MDTMIMTTHDEPITDGELLLWPSLGIACQADRSRSVAYDAAYLGKYLEYADTPLSDSLCAHRLDLVHPYLAPGDLCFDLGASAGEFLATGREQMPECRWGGWDISPEARAHLAARDLLLSRDMIGRARVVTAWDVFEHLPEPESLLAEIAVGSRLVIAIPIHDDMWCIRSSKHYRPDEHYWHFTRGGIVRYFSDRGWQCEYQGSVETQLGRESVESFVFHRAPRIVLATGCFDALHPGHVDLLQRARALGDRLIVGINSDASVRRLKGPARPLIDQDSRRAMLLALQCVDQVEVFAEATASELIDRLRPAVWVKGGDYSRDRLPEADLVEQLGGRVEILPLRGDWSTTRLHGDPRAPRDR